MTEYGRALSRVEMKKKTKLAVDSYLARYTGKTLAQYDFCLAKYLTWIGGLGLHPLNDVKRMHIEQYIRQLQQEGRKPATVGHYMSPVAGFYKYAFLDGVIERNPAAYVRRPKVWDDPNHGTSLRPYEFREIIAAGHTTPHACDAGVVALMFMLGLRVSEATSIQITDYDHFIEGHQVLKFIGKGNKPAIIPLPISVLRLFDKAAEGRKEGPLLVQPYGKRKAPRGAPMSREAVATSIRRLCRIAHIEKTILPHDARRSHVTNGLRAGISMRKMQLSARHSDPRTTERYDMDRASLDEHAVHVLAAHFFSAA